MGSIIRDRQIDSAVCMGPPALRWVGNGISARSTSSVFLPLLERGNGLCQVKGMSKIQSNDLVTRDNRWQDGDRGGGK